jgi:predicted regulator of Ras-like GTPase activity (Roadblock/LC7/MglB family)
MSVAGDIKSIIAEIRKANKIETCMVVSRNGIPIAWEMPNDSQVETLATLCATILGAADVVYGGIGKPKTHSVAMRSNGDIVLITGLGTKALIVFGSSIMDEESLRKVASDASTKIEEVLKRET